MLDDELLLKAAEGVDYSSLPTMPTPEDFYLLSRVKGATSVAQLCAASGWGKEKAKGTIEKLVEYGLLIPEGEVAKDGPKKQADPGATAEADPGATAEADPGATAEADPGATAEREDTPVPRDHEATPVASPDSADDERQRAVTPQRSAAVERGGADQQPNRDHVQTPVRDEPKSSFNIPVVEEDEDDLFMSDSPAHLSRLREPKMPRSSKPTDASSTRPFDEAEDFVSSLEAETSARDDADEDADAAREPDTPEPDAAVEQSSEAEAHAEPESKMGSEPSEPGFAILDSEVAEDIAVPEDDKTQMMDPTSLDIATSVATVDSDRVKTNRGGAAVDGPLAFAMLPGKLSEFTVDPELLDPALEIDPRARQEVAYVHQHLDSVNHYELFGVSPEANRKEIKKAYFVLSKRFHPDLYFRKNVGPFAEMVEDVFKSVTNAYRILSHRKKRAAYDDELKNAPVAMPAVGSAASGEAGSRAASELEEKKKLALELLLKRGNTHEVKGEFIRAADCFRKAISIKSEPELFVKLGNALYRANKRLDDAAKYCRTALRGDPKNLDAMLVLAKILERNEVYDEALELLQNAKSLAPDEASIDVHEDRIRSLMGDG